ncbi:hypothetical protein ONS95_013837 [Cadophora gregata]|uniref:uncharacterized protein n=1 Tax=Cadophora gregata TaxID=51156 RepID=UPI0026DC0CD1|nr:uncharacterized protein ONS95_013837 [Cadophora gregata]KAK0113590.1 hypothetical protein ONS96_014446 [Cadophora gregata f. sp. sojae]KAK0114345.1 hypothetical protein ONS95_013837 [Cadophora gregata]
MMALLRIQPRAVGAEPVNHVPAEIPRAGMVISTILSMLTIAVLAICFTRRTQAIRNWSKVPLTRWLILIIYGDSILFIFATAILEHGFGLNLNMMICGSAILLCLICYMSTKVIYYFLVEKVYIIRSVSKPRLKSKLYLFNCFGMLLPYIVCVILNFVYRTAYFTPDGTCIIGMEMKAMMPLIIFDAVVNFYLTMLFVLPLRSLYSYKNTPNSALRTIALRSFVGSLATLTSSVVNLTVLMVLKGEEAWICLMCCNADILFSVLVLHWVTSKDSGGGTSVASNTSRGLTSRRRQRQESESLASPTAGTIDKLQRFGVFGDQVIGGGSVTTHISAEKSNDIADAGVQRGQETFDLENAPGGRMKRNKSVKEEYPMGRIQVQVGHTVETTRKGGVIIGMNEGDVGDFPLARTHLSTDELVKKF